MEKWKQLKNFNEYKVSNFDNVRNINASKILTKYQDFYSSLLMFILLRMILK
jgi:hypothetical protein